MPFLSSYRDAFSIGPYNTVYTALVGSQRDSISEPVYPQQICPRPGHAAVSERVETYYIGV